MKRILQVLVAASLVVRTVIELHRDLGFDETQALHAAYSVARGLVPYRDFWDNHTPLLSYALAPLILAGGEGASLVDAGRAIMAILGVVLFVLTYRIARRVLDETAAWLALLLLAGCRLFTLFVQIRPDTPYLVAWLGCLLVLLHRPDGRRRAFAAGLLLGVGATATPKALYALTAVSLALVAIGLHERRLRRALIQISLFGLGFLVPLVLLAGAFAAAGALGPLFRWTLAFNFTIPAGARFRPWDPVTSPGFLPFAAVALVGIAGIVADARRRLLDPRWIVLGTCGVVLFAIYALVAPMPFLQTAMAACPPLAIVGARILAFLPGRGRGRTAILGVAALAALVAPALALRPLAPLLLRPSPGLLAQIALDGAVRERTSPEDAVLSSDAQAFTRPSAWFFPALTRELVVLLQRGDYPPADVPDVIAALRASRCPLIIEDDTLRQALPQALGWIHDHYLALDHGVLLVPGWRLGPDHPSFEVIAPGRYRFDGEGTIDGWAAAGFVLLGEGAHAYAGPGAVLELVPSRRPHERGMMTR